MSMSRMFTGVALAVALQLAVVPPCSCDETIRSFPRKYAPTWESIDSRPLPAWYDEAKLGIFITWGLYSVPGLSNEWFYYWWRALKNPVIVEFMRKNYPPSFTYPDFAEQFTAEFYDANQWAEIFQASGAKYMVFVTKHHDGYTNWPSKRAFSWNSMDVGPKRDIVGELAAAIKNKTSLHFGLYHSLFEWFHPLYLQDKANNWTTNNFVKEKTMPELFELVNNYEPEVVWSDGDWEAPDYYWQSKEFIAWLYNESPVRDTVVTNDRWGKGIICHHGGFLTCSDRYNPKTLMKRKFENAMTLDRKSWGYRRNADLADYLTIEELLKTFIITISCGGNMEINVGPTKDGRVPVIYEERLRQVGAWLAVTGEAVYGSRPWTHQNDTWNPDVWYTSKKTENGTAVYAFLLQWPRSDTLTLGSVTYNPGVKVSLLGYPGEIFVRGSPVGMDIWLPSMPISKMPCQWAWVFKMSGLE